MLRIFENRVTPEGRTAAANLIDHVAQLWNQTMETQGAGSFEAALQGLLLAYLYYLMQEYEKADPLIRHYVTVAEEKYGPHSDEVLCGLILLSNNCIGWGRLEDSRSVLEQLKPVAESCLPWRDPLLEALYDLAVGCQNADGPTNEQRGFILSLMALSWCVRYASGDHIYTQYAPRLKSIFEAYGFVNDRWEWLIQSCKHNLHDLLGLISILLEKHLLPSEAQPPLTAEMRDTVLGSLLQEYRLDGEDEYGIQSDGGTRVLTFLCPLCGSRNLRTKMLDAPSRRNAASHRDRPT